MEKESWINEVMDSTKGMKPLDANPFLFEKISLKIEAKKSDISQVKAFSKSWALAASLVLIINIVSFAYIIKDKPSAQKEMGYTALSKEMGLTSTTNY
ncbi:MAG: hypothetical protein ABI388_01000 [Bacteroidia bacterium]